MASYHGQPYDRVFVDTDQATGLPHAAALLQVLPDGEGLRFREFAVVQRGALAFTEALLAGAAGQHTALLLGSIAEADAQVAESATAVVGARGVLTAEVFQVVHEPLHHPKAREKAGPATAITVESWRTCGKTDRTRPEFPDEPNLQRINSLPGSPLRKLCAVGAL